MFPQDLYELSTYEGFIQVEQTLHLQQNNRGFFTKNEMLLYVFTSLMTRILFKKRLNVKASGMDLLVNFKQYLLKAGNALRYK